MITLAQGGKTILTVDEDSILGELEFPVKAVREGRNEPPAYIRLRLGTLGLQPKMAWLRGYWRGLGSETYLKQEWEYLATLVEGTATRITLETYMPRPKKGGPSRTPHKAEIEVYWKAEEKK